MADRGASGRRRSGLGLVILALGSIALLGCGDSEETGPFAVGDAWSRPTPATATTASVYLQVTGGPDGDRLTGASVDPSIAEAVTLHETTTMEHDMSSMQPGEDMSDMTTMRDVEEITIDPDGRVQLEPGGTHLMLEGLVEPLEQGDTFAITLTFDRAGSVDVSVAVDDR